jgi:NOL1/NOP2/fmu family ribosome biogenesis protein
MNDYLQLFQNLKIIKAGTRIATVKKNDFLPAHDLALSILSANNPFPCEELNYEDAIAFLRKDNLKVRLNARGWNIVSYRGANLGLVNNLGTRLNNYFPVEWRIRMNVPVNSEKDLIQWE